MDGEYKPSTSAADDVCSKIGAHTSFYDACRRLVRNLCLYVSYVFPTQRFFPENFLGLSVSMTFIPVEGGERSEKIMG